MSNAATTGENKVCPDCAEEVKAAANVCRFCGFRFADAEATYERDLRAIEDIRPRPFPPPSDSHASTGEVAEGDSPLARLAKRRGIDQAPPKARTNEPSDSWIDRHKVLFAILLTVAAVMLIGVVAVAKAHKSTRGNGGQSPAYTAGYQMAKGMAEPGDGPACSTSDAEIGLCSSSERIIQTCEATFDAAVASGNVADDPAQRDDWNSGCSDGAP